MAILDKLFEMISKWPPIGQGFFVLMILGVFTTMIAQIFRYLAIAVRGWPPAGECDCEDDADDDD
jgi:hypothetical protein